MQHLTIWRRMPYMSLLTRRMPVSTCRIPLKARFGSQNCDVPDFRSGVFLFILTPEVDTSPASHIAALQDACDVERDVLQVCTQYVLLENNSCDYKPYIIYLLYSLFY
jgi:hypothetical protein